MRIGGLRLEPGARVQIHTFIVQIIYGCPNGRCYKGIGILKYSMFDVMAFTTNYDQCASDPI